MLKRLCPQRRKKAAKKPIVLVVDHSAQSRSLARRILEDSGLEVLTAVNGLHAAHLFREHPIDIDLVLVDMALPHMDGIDTFLAIRDVRRDAKVILTGVHDDNASLERILSFGFAGFAEKPFDAPELVGKVQQALAA